MNSEEQLAKPSETSSTERSASSERKRELRESMPGCVAIVEAFRVFEPRVMEMEEIRSGIVWRRG